MKKILLITFIGAFSLNFSQVAEQINTSDWQTPLSTHVDGLNQSSLPYQDIKLPEFKNPDAINYNNSVKSENINSQSKVDKIVNDMFPDKNKIDITTTVDIRNTHKKKANSDTWVPKTEQNDEKSLAPYQSSNNSTSSVGNLIPIVLVIVLILVVVYISRSLFGLSKKKNNNNKENRDGRKIIFTTEGGQPEMREFIRSMFQRLEGEIRLKESHLSDMQIREKIIEVIFNISKNLLYAEVSKFQVKYKITELEANQVIANEISRYIIMLK